MLRSTFKRNYSEQVLVQARTGAAAKDVSRGVGDVVQRLQATGDATNIRSPLAPGNSGQLSQGGRSALVTFEVKGTAGDEQYTKIDKVDPLLAATAAASRAHPTLRIEQFGDASVQKAVNKSISDDLAKAQKLSLPITLAILVLAFGALAAAGVPVLLAVTAVIATSGLIAIPSHFAPVDAAVAEVILLLGMAVGVDYALFYLRREREERAAGKDADAALDAAAATSGRSVLVSGLTVMTAMAGMYFTGDKTFESYATGGILVVAVAVLGSLTVLPAILSKLGDKVMKGRVPIIGRRREAGTESRFWSAILGPVLRHPGISTVASVAVLIALTIPALGMKTGNSGINGLPQGLAITKTLKHAQAAFPGDGVPAQVVIQAPRVKAPEVQSAIKRLERGALASGRFNNPMTVDVNEAGTAAVVSMPISAGNGTDQASNAALATLRGQLVPADGRQRARRDGERVRAHRSVEGLQRPDAGARADRVRLRAGRCLPGAAGHVPLDRDPGEGDRAEPAVGRRRLRRARPGVPEGLVRVAARLQVDRRHRVVATGVPVRGPLRALDGLPRVHRQPDPRGVRSRDDTDEAVEHGIKSTASVVTSAAIVMVAVFSIFATLGALMLKELGVGLAVAVLIDATIVRAVLLPASMKLLGDWNWYLPKRLQWLPRIRLEHEVKAGPARA